MLQIIEQAPDVANAFFSMTKAIKQFSPLSEKTNELILIGIFSAQNAPRGLKTHIERALKEGATKEEILAAVLLALPVVGVTSTNQAFETVLEFLKNYNNNENH